MEEPVRQIELDCAQLHVLDLSFPIAALMVVVLILPRVVSVAVQLIFAIITLLCRILTLIYSVCLVLDGSVESDDPSIPNVNREVVQEVTINNPYTLKNVDRKNTDMVGLSSANKHQRLRLRFHS